MAGEGLCRLLSTKKSEHHGVNLRCVFEELVAMIEVCAETTNRASRREDKPHHGVTFLVPIPSKKGVNVAHFQKGSPP